jgi:hypothetical protein
MDSAAGEEQKKRSKGLNFLPLIAASLLFAGAYTARLWIVDEYHANPLWLLGAAAVIFFLVEGWGYRQRLRDPAFGGFLLGC